MVNFKIDYDVTDEQLLAHGISNRVIELSRQPFMRPGGIDFDIRYALSVMDASEEVSLAALSINNPDKPVHFPPCEDVRDARMGFVPNTWRPNDCA